MLGDAPGYFSDDLLLGAIDHVELLVILDADHEFVWLVLTSTCHISVCKVSLGERNDQLIGAFLRISFEFAEEHAVVSTETDFVSAGSHDDVEDGVYFEWLGHQYLAHGVNVNDVYVAKVLPKYHKLFFRVLILKNLHVIYTLLQLFIVFLLKSVDIEHKQMAIVTTNPGQIIVHFATKKPMSRRFFQLLFS